MTQASIQIGTATFDQDFLTATREDGLTVKFSRSERLLLLHMLDNSGALLTRSQLLDAISEPGSDKTDRNVDFIVNRLRRKLDDRPSEPSFIATQYGEGYIWVAKKAAKKPLGTGAYLVIGPIRGLSYIGDFSLLAEEFSKLLLAELTHQIGPSNKVVLDTDCPPLRAFVTDPPKFEVSLTFVRKDDILECVVHTKNFQTAKLITIQRLVINDCSSEKKSRYFVARMIAECVVKDIWVAHAKQPDDLVPLPVSMHDASIDTSGVKANWKESERRLNRVIEVDPDDAAAKLMKATNIHSKYIFMGHQIFLGPGDPRSEDENNIERLVSECLPHIQDQPHLVMTAAKLLFFIDRGYRRMAVELSEASYQTATTVVASFAAMGQMRSFLGEIDDALQLFDQALELCEEGSEIEAYILVLKCQAHLAAGEQEKLDNQLQTLYKRRPAAKSLLSISWAFPSVPSARAKESLNELTEMDASAIILYNFYVSARLFKHTSHLENTLQPTIQLLSDHFGQSVIPEEVKTLLPSRVNA